MIEKITLIIPLRLTASTYEGELRLKRLCAVIPRDLFDILISDYGTEEAYWGPIAALSDHGVEVARHPSPEPVFSIGCCRDFGVQMARRRVVLFNDIDFLGTADMYRRIHAEAIRRNIADNLFDFFCVPVLFLTASGTAAWFAAETEARQFVERFDVDWLEDHAAEIQFTAFGSSAMVVNRHHYLSLGGHDRRFRGHGAEDYDILHRLSSLAPLAPRPHDYYTDYKTNAVRQYWGFRPFFALYGLEAFSREVHLVHLWHPRRAERGYFRSRQNFPILETLMKDFDREGLQPPPLADLRRSERIVVFSPDKTRTMRLFRSFLSCFGGYVVVEQPLLPEAGTVADLAAREQASHILFDLYREEDAVSAGAALPQAAGISVLVAVRGQGELALRQVSGPASSAAIVTQTHDVRGPDDRILIEYPQRLAISGLPVIDSGVRPAMVDMQSPLLASFGGTQALDRRTHDRPALRKKTRFWIRFYRWLTGR